MLPCTVYREPGGVELVLTSLPALVGDEEREREISLAIPSRLVVCSCPLVQDLLFVSPSQHLLSSFSFDSTCPLHWQYTFGKLLLLPLPDVVRHPSLVLLHIYYVDGPFYYFERASLLLPTLETFCAAAAVSTFLRTLGFGDIRHHVGDLVHRFNISNTCVRRFPRYVRNRCDISHGIIRLLKDRQ